MEERGRGRGHVRGGGAGYPREGRAPKKGGEGTRRDEKEWRMSGSCKGRIRSSAGGTAKDQSMDYLSWKIFIFKSINVSALTSEIFISSVCSAQSDSLECVCVCV